MSYADKIRADSVLRDIHDTSARGMIASTEVASTASTPHAVGDYFIYNDLLYLTTTDIAIGDIITPNMNCTAITVGGEVSDLKSAFDDISEPNKNIWSGVNSFTLTKGTSNYYPLEITPPAVDDLVLSFKSSDTSLTSIGVETYKNGTSVENQSVTVASGSRSSVIISNTDFDALRIYLKSSTATGATITVSEIQLEKGTTATPYVSPMLSAVDLIARSQFEKYNLVKLSSGSIAGVTYTKQDDSSVEFDGTATGQGNIILCVVPAGTYFAEIKVISGTNTDPVAVRYSNATSSDTYWTGTNVSGSNKTFDSKTTIIMRYNTGYVYSHCVVQITVIVADKLETAVDIPTRTTVSIMEGKLDGTTDISNELYLPSNLLAKYNAHSCVNKLDFDLSSSTHILAYGDSITQGGNWGDSWVDFICDMLNCTATNKSHSGALFGESVRTNTYWISTQLSDTTSSEWQSATMVVVAAGTNDAGYDTPDSELYAKVASAITTIKANTNAPILFITPIKRGPSDSDANYLKLAKISGIIEHVALLNKCSVICGLNFPIPSHDQGVISGMMSGYIHPNSDGGYIYAMSVIDELM